MIRIVRDPEGIAVFDIDGRLPGRGAYVCPLPACLRKLSSSSLGHHLKASVSLPDFRNLRAGLAATYEKKVRNLLSIGLKAGQVRVGSRAVEEALDRGHVSLLVLAADMASRTERRLVPRAQGISVRRVERKERLGSWLGRLTAASAIVVDRGLALRLAALLDRLTSIENSSYDVN